MFLKFINQFRTRLVGHIDGPLLAIALALMAFGLATVYSATYGANNRALGQLLNMLIGLAAMWAVAQIPPQKMMRFAVPLYVVGVVLLVLVYLAFGATILGYGLWSRLLSRYPASQVAPFSLLVPVVGLTSSALLLDERLSSLQLVGALLVMFGLLLNFCGGWLQERLRARWA